MNPLYDQIIFRFPEVHSPALDDNADNPYSLMTMLVEWLGRGQVNADSPEVIERVKQFIDWCESQPRGRTAADDLLTILAVSFYEPLFATEQMRRILPRLITQEYFQKNQEYLKNWVGEENYNNSKKYFDRDN